jgi:acetyl esterase/lipase
MWTASLGVLVSMMLPAVVAAAQPEMQGNLTACPTVTPTPPPDAGRGAPGGSANLVFAQTIAASDTSTSIVIDPSGSTQIQCAAGAVKSVNDVIYATVPDTTGAILELKLDLLQPADGQKRPLIVYLPGGGFVNSDKSASLNLRTYLAGAGFAVASLHYHTISDGATYVDAVTDVKAAIRFLRGNADRFTIDTSRVVVWGESAGGYLAAMVGTTNGVAKFETGDNLSQSSDVQAVVDESGPSDLSRIASDFDSAAQQAFAGPVNNATLWINGPTNTRTLDEMPDAVAAANAVMYVDSSDPPFLILHGSADRLVSPSQTVLLQNALLANRVDSTRYVVQGADHGDLSFLGDASAGRPWSTQQVMGLVVAFLDKNLG